MELWTYLSINFEENKKKNFHMHCMIGIRSLLGYNENIKTNLKNILRDNYEFDIYIKECETILDSKIKTHYCFKKSFEYSEHNWFFFIFNRQQLFAELIDFLNSSDFKENTSSGGLEQNEIIDNLNGLRKIDKEKNKNIILNLWNYYLLINKLYIYNDNIYLKLNNYKIAFEKKENINILYKEFKEKIIPFFINNFPIQFKNYDFYEILSKYIINYQNLLETLKLITSNKFKPDYNLLEFTDGIYNMKTNKFLPKKEITISNLNKISTIKFYSITYKHLKKPNIWISNIERTLSKNHENINKLYLFIANIFHQNNFIFNKKKVLFIIGDSNTQKTTLIVKPLINFFGEENIGVITQGSNFNFQDVHDKILVVIDEYKHNNKLESDLLKWFEGSNIKSEQKYKKPENLENKPTIIISNNDIEVKNEKVKEAFENRFIKLVFEYKLKPKEINELIINQIKNEEASIIIHCNKIYFNNIINKKTRLNYNKSIDLINYYQKEI